MSATTISTSGGLPRSHASDENKGRRAALKARSRAPQLHMKPVNENPTHPGKTVNPVSLPLSTPRKALSKIDTNASRPSATPSQKGSLSSQSSKKRSDRKRVTGVKSKQSLAQVGGSKAVESAVKDVDTECFPDIEVMSTKLEHDEWDNGRLFVPPAYFDNLAAALKSTPLPPIGCFPPASSLSSLRLEPETALRPSRLASGPSVISPLCDPMYGDDILLTVDLPDLDQL